MASIPVLDTPFLAQKEEPIATSSASPEGGQEVASTPRVNPNGIERESFTSDTEADGSEAEHTSGWLSSRSRGRDEESRKLFSLPLTEHLMDDYMCALQRRMLHQGRLYIFEHYVCFNSSIFGYEKNRVIPLKDVTAIKKKKNCGFPNSIEISYSGKKDFFTSFLFREDAFRLLSYAWNRSNSGYVKLFGGPDTEKALKAIMTKVSKNPSMAGSSPRQQSGELPSDVGGSKGGASYKKEKVYGSSKLAKILHRRKGSDGGSNEPATQSSLESSNDSQVFGTRNKESPELLDTFEARTEEGSESGDDDAGSGTGDAEKWKPLPLAAPPVDPSMKPVLQETFSMPVKDFYHQFFSDESQFFTTWHESRGDTKVKKSAWQSHSSMGHVRQIQFVTPLKQVIGPSKCLCEQTQRLRLFQGDYLVLETSQIMSEIPYGDHFKVEARWDITPHQGGRACKLETHLAIPFSKKTIWKSTIEKSTQESIKTAMEDWVRTAKRWMEPPLPLPPGSAFSGGNSIEGNSGAGSKEATHMSRAQSLAIRLSSDRSPDVDGLLDRVPSEYRDDIARVLKLRRLEANQQVAKKLSRAMSHRASFAQLPDEVEEPSIKRLITWPRVLVAIVAFALMTLQVLILLRASGTQSAIPGALHGARDSMGSAVVCPVPASLELQGSLSRGQSPSERPGLEEVATMQAQLVELRRDFDALQSRLEYYARVASAEGA